MEDIIESLIYVPEQLPRSLNFQIAGYTTFIFIMNAYSDILLYAIMIILMILFLMIYILINKCCYKSCYNKVGKIQNFFFWNGSIRLFISSYLQTLLFSMLNLHEMSRGEDQPDKDFEVVQISNILCVTFFVLCFLTPVGIMIYLRYNRHRLTD